MPPSSRVHTHACAQPETAASAFAARDHDAGSLIGLANALTDLVPRMSESGCPAGAPDTSQPGARRPLLDMDPGGLKASCMCMYMCVC